MSDGVCTAGEWTIEGDNEAQAGQCGFGLHVHDDGTGIIVAWTDDGHGAHGSAAQLSLSKDQVIALRTAVCPRRGDA